MNNNGHFWNLHPCEKADFRLNSAVSFVAPNWNTWGKRVSA
jgi:hypothetical protein